MYRMAGKQTTAIWTALEVLLLSVCKSPTLSLTFHQTQISWLFFTTFRFASFHFILFLCKLYSFMWIYAFKWKKTSKKRCVYNHGDSYLLRFTHTSMRVKDGMTEWRNEFAGWHAARLPDWRNYAEFDLWKMAQRKIIEQESMRSSLPRLFLAPIWSSNGFAGPFITAIKARLNWNTGDTWICSW